MAPPCERQAPNAPSSRVDTMKSLKRAATMATRRSRAVISPATTEPGVTCGDAGVWINEPATSGVRPNVGFHGQAERRQTVHLLGLRHHSHPADTQVLQDLRANAESAQHHSLHVQVR